MSRILCFFLGHKIMIRTFCGIPLEALCDRCNEVNEKLCDYAFRAWENSFGLSSRHKEEVPK